MRREGVSQLYFVLRSAHTRRCGVSCARDDSARAYRRVTRIGEDHWKDGGCACVAANCRRERRRRGKRPLPLICRSLSRSERSVAHSLSKPRHSLVRCTSGLQRPWRMIREIRDCGGVSSKTSGCPRWRLRWGIPTDWGWCGDPVVGNEATFGHVDREWAAKRAITSHA